MASQILRAVASRVWGPVRKSATDPTVSAASEGMTEAVSAVERIGPLKPMPAVVAKDMASFREALWKITRIRSSRIACH